MSEQQLLFPEGDTKKETLSWRDGVTRYAREFVRLSEAYLCGNFGSPRSRKMLIDVVHPVKLGVWVVTYKLTPEELVRRGLDHFVRNEIILKNPFDVDAPRDILHPLSWLNGLELKDCEVDFLMDARAWVRNESNSFRGIVSKAIEDVKSGVLPLFGKLSVEDFLAGHHAKHRSQRCCDHCGQKNWKTGKPPHVITFVEEAEKLLELVVNHDSARAKDVVFLIFHVKEGYFVPDKQTTPRAVLRRYV